MKTKDYVWRIVKTFIQAFASAVVVELVAAIKSGVDLTDKNAVKGLIVGLVSAGFCAAMNAPKRLADYTEGGANDEVQ